MFGKLGSQSCHTHHSGFVLFCFFEFQENSVVLLMPLYRAIICYSYSRLLFGAGKNFHPSLIPDKARSGAVYVNMNRVTMFRLMSVPGHDPRPQVLTGHHALFANLSLIWL